MGIKDARLPGEQQWSGRRDQSRFQRFRQWESSQRVQGLLRQTEQLQIQPVEQKWAVISSRSKQEALDLDLANTDATD